MALSDMVVRQAKAIGKDYTLGDLDGLSLGVDARGNKSWHFRYSWLRRQKRMSLGPYPQISLREARALRDQARALVAKGINPQRQREKDRQLAIRSGQDSFAAVYKKWLAFRKQSRLMVGRQTTLAMIPRIFEKDILPVLRQRSIHEVTRADLLEVVGRIEKRGAPSVAGKVRTWLNQLFRYALVIVPDLERNPASDLDVVAMPQPPVRHNPFPQPARNPQCLATPQRAGKGQGNGSRGKALPGKAKRASLVDPASHKERHNHQRRIRWIKGACLANYP